MGCFQTKKPEPGDFSYRGLHDQGPLPALREGGNIAVLAGCVLEAKKFNDDFVTAEIAKAKQLQQKIERATSPPKKRMKDGA